MLLANRDKPSDKQIRDKKLFRTTFLTAMIPVYLAGLVGVVSASVHAKDFISQRLLSKPASIDLGPRKFVTPYRGP